MSAKIYSLEEYRQRKKTNIWWKTMKEDWDAVFIKRRIRCFSCPFFGIEPGTNKPGCTHKYRNFFENCPLEDV